jgi:hypothetical protein
MKGILPAHLFFSQKAPKYPHLFDPFDNTGTKAILDPLHRNGGVAGGQGWVFQQDIEISLSLGKANLHPRQDRAQGLTNMGWDRSRHHDCVTLMRYLHPCPEVNLTVFCPDIRTAEDPYTRV